MVYAVLWVLDLAVLICGCVILIGALARRTPTPTATPGPRYPTKAVVVDGYTRPSAGMMALVDRHDEDETA